MPPPVDVPERVDHVRGLQLVAVADDDQRRVWNELMRREHPHGAVRHVGAQMRYLLVSEHGVLGALGFAAADEWAQHEFGGAPLGDVRLSKRLVKSARIQSEAPTKSFPGAAQNEQAAVRGSYRMIDQPAA